VFCNLGIKIGSTISNQSWEYQNLNFDREFDNWMGGYFGIYYQLLEKKPFTIYAELSFSTMGTKEQIQGEIVWENTQGYVDTELISLINKFSFCSAAIIGRLKPNVDRIIPYLCIGPRVDYLIDKKSNYNSIVIKEFETFGYGLVYGVGLEINLFHSNNIIFESTLNTDLSYLYKTDVLSVKKLS